MPTTQMPPVTRPLQYAWRVCAKALSFFLFGVGALLLTLLFLPVLKIRYHPFEHFRAQARRLVSWTFRGFITLMHLMRIVDLQVDNREQYRHLASKIVIANHPSLLDVVMLISLIPNADCIVHGYLNHNLVRGIVRQLYLFNTLDFDTLVQSCAASLRNGNCLIIFPEGTRTRRTGEPKLRRGAAHIALVTGAPLVPVHIGGTDKYGLGKHDPFFSFNHTEKYVYDLALGTEISVTPYRNQPRATAARALTAEMRQVLFQGAIVSKPQ